MKPTHEQQAIYEYGARSRDNLLIEALAGSGKTSTLVGLTRVLPGTTLAVAFNVRIKEELSRRMPPSAECKTLNSVGFTALRRLINKLGSRADTSKRSTILRNYIADCPNTALRNALSDSFSEIREALASAISCGWIPEGTRFASNSLLSDQDFYNSLDFYPSEWQIDAIRACHIKGIRECLENGWADFDDQIFIPTLFGGAFPRCDNLLIDEAQDLSPLQHAMIRKMRAPGTRIIAVGDSCQAIYGFRGAHESSMQELRETFKMNVLPLNISFRLPRAVAEHVRWRAPSIASPEWAQEGKVSTLTEWGQDAIPDGAAIICRNNSPLFAMALKLMRAGRRPSLIGLDITKNLIADLKSLGKDSTPSKTALDKLPEWTEKMNFRKRSKGHVQDRADCMEVFLRETETIGEAAARASAMLDMPGTITLTTGHKAKGLEWDHVFFLNQSLIKPERDPQANNLRYVIATRARQTLTYIDSSGALF